MGDDRSLVLDGFTRLVIGLAWFGSEEEKARWGTGVVSSGEWGDLGCATDGAGLCE